MPNFNEQQQKAIDLVVEGKNVVVEALAGSGKTTLALGIRKAVNATMLILTYNKLLCTETQERFDREMKIRRSLTTIRTLHSFVQRMYDVQCSTDEGMEEVIRRDLKPVKRISFKLFILDEVQDFKPLFYATVLKIIKDNDIGDPQIVVLGDRTQNIFAYQGSDERFLIYAPTLYERCSDRHWARVTLNTTYRMNKAHVQFLNRVIFKQDRFNSDKEGPKPLVIRCKFFHDVLNLLKENSITIGNKATDTYRPGEVFVLGHSLVCAGMRDPPIKSFANRLAEQGVPLHYPKPSEPAPSGSDAAGKVLFSTLHKSKGRERSLVVLFGFDGSWFESKAGAEYAGTTCCPNEWGVALTRNCEQLVMVADIDAEPLPYASWDNSDDLYDLVELGKARERKPRKDTSRNATEMQVSSLLSHQPSHDMKIAFQGLRITEMSSLPKARMPTVVRGRFGLDEDVTDVVEKTIGMWAEFVKTGKVSMGSVDDIPGASLDIAGSIHRALDGMALEKGSANLARVTELALIKHCLSRKLIHLIKQLPESFDWIMPYKEDVFEIAKRLDGSFFDVNLEQEIADVVLKGTAEVISKSGNVTIVNYRSNIDDSQCIEAAILSILHSSTTPVKPAHIVNAKTGKRLCVELGDGFHSALSNLIRNKSENGSLKKSDDQFIAQCSDIAATWTRTAQPKILVFFKKII